MLDQWTTMSKNMMNSFPCQAPDWDKGKALFEHWYEDQKQLVEKMTQVHSPEEAMQKAPQAYQDMLNLQMDYTRKWMGLYQEYQSHWSEGDLSDTWKSFVKHNQKAIEGWVSQTNEIIRDAVGPFMPFSKVPRFANIGMAYDELSRYWEPILSMIQGKNSYQPFNLSPNAFQGILNNLMNVNLPDRMQEMAQHANTLFASYNDWLTHQAAGFTKQMPNVNGSMDMGPWLSMMQDMQQRMQDSFAPMSQFASNGMQSEMMDLVREAQGEYMQYALEATEIQMQIFDKTQHVLPQTLETLKSQYEKSKQIPTYDQFFNLFISNLEHQLIELFETEEYASMQNEVATSSVKVKNRMNRFMEIMFRDAPFSTRSELSELAQELASLRRKVRSLEKELSALQAQPAAKPKPASRKRSPKASADSASSGK